MPGELGGRAPGPAVPPGVQTVWSRISTHPSCLLCEDFSSQPALPLFWEIVYNKRYANVRASLVAQR